MTEKHDPEGHLFGDVGPSPASTEDGVSTDMDQHDSAKEQIQARAMEPPADESNVSEGEVLVDYKQTDYRGFLFVVHDNHGLMLLQCTRKKQKGNHYQVPGGHVDEHEFLEAGMS